MNEVRLVRVLNPIDATQKEVKRVAHTGAPLLEYIDDDGKVIAVVEGRVVPRSEWGLVIPQPGSEITVRPQFQGSGFWAVFARIALAATAIAAMVLLPGPVGALLGSLIWTAGSLLLNWLLPMPGHKSTDSQSYGWSAATMTAQEGLPIPSQVGTLGGDMRTGNVIASYVKVNGALSYSNILLCLGHGLASDIINIRINGQPASNFSGVQIEKRLGYLEQDTIPWFDSVINDYPYSQIVSHSGGPQLFLLHRYDTTSIEVEVSFLQGLYTSSGGGINSTSVNWGVEYSPDGSVWSTVVSPFTTASIGTDYWMAVTNDAYLGGVGNIIVLETDAVITDHHEGETFTKSYTLTAYTSTGSPYTTTRTFSGYWTKNPAYVDSTAQQGGTPVVSSAWTDITKTTSASSTGPIRDTIRIDGLAPGQYWIRVTKISPDLVSPNQNTMYVTSIKEMTADKIAYGGMILLGINALATDQLSGADITITAEVIMANPETTGYKWSVLYDKPIAFYRLNELSGTTAHDSAGSFDGTYNSGVTLNATPIIKNSPSRAAYFGPGSEVDTPTLTLDLDWTIEGWMRIPLTDTGPGIFVTQSGDTTLVVNQDGTLKTETTGGSDTLGTALPGGTIVHAVWRNKAGVITVYRNGLPLGASAATPASPTTVARVAVNGTGSLQQGVVVQDVAIYDHALRLGRIGQHWEMGNAPTNALEDYAANNPAVAALAVWCDKVYGGGRSFKDVDWATLQDYADWCNELVPVISSLVGGYIPTAGQMYRHVINGIFDARTTVWGALAKIGAATQSNFLTRGTKLSVVSNRDMPTAQVFGMGNILEGSFNESWMASIDRANSVTVEFQDQLQQYGRTPVMVDDQSAIVAGVQEKPSGSIDAWGITDEPHAWNLGSQWLSSTKLQRRLINFSAQFEAVHCQVGDKVLFSHDVPKLGLSGRVLAVSGTQFTLDQEVPIDSAVTTQMLLRLDYVLRYTGTIASIDGGSIAISGWDPSIGNAKRLSLAPLATVDAFTGDPTLALPAITFDERILRSLPGLVVIDEDAAGSLLVGDTVYIYDTDVLIAENLSAVGGTTVGTVTTTNKVQIGSAPAGRIRIFDPYIINTPTQAPLDLKILSIEGDGDYHVKISCMIHDVQQFVPQLPVTPVGGPGIPADATVMEVIAIANITQVSDGTSTDFYASAPPGRVNFTGSGYSGVGAYGNQDFWTNNMVTGAPISADNLPAFLLGSSMFIGYNSTVFASSLNDTAFLTGVRMAIIYTSANPTISNALPLPAGITVPAGSGLAWAQATAVAPFVLNPGAGSASGSLTTGSIIAYHSGSLGFWLEANVTWAQFALLTGTPAASGTFADTGLALVEQQQNMGIVVIATWKNGTTTTSTAIYTAINGAAPTLIGNSSSNTFTFPATVGQTIQVWAVGTDGTNTDTLATAPTATITITQPLSIAPISGNFTPGALGDTSVVAATTGPLPNSPTYANGTAGVGATLTATTTGTLTIDGYAPAVGDRVLIKDQASAFQNGIYIITATGDASNPYVLTRATNYVSSADIQNTGAILVHNGTANATTSWAIDTVPTVIGTDPLTYHELTIAPTTIQTKPNSVAITTTAPGNFTVAHTLGRVPHAVLIEMTSGGFIWFQTPTRYDATHLYLVASDTGLTAVAQLF